MVSFSRVTFDPLLLGGQACIRGMRLPVATVVRFVASGKSTKEIIDAYPELDAEDIAKSLRYAAGLTEDRLMPLSSSGA